MQEHPLIRTTFLGVAALAALASVPAAIGQTVTILLREGEPAPWVSPTATVSGIAGTTVNHAGGFAASIFTVDDRSNLSHIWGSVAGAVPNVLYSETHGLLPQASFEPTFGMSNTGELAVSALLGHGVHRPLNDKPGFTDSLFLGAVPFILEGTPIEDKSTTYWRFASRVGMTTIGEPYWLGGVTNVEGGFTTSESLYFGGGKLALLTSGMTIDGLPHALDTAHPVAHFGFSPTGTHWTAVVNTIGTETFKSAVIQNGRVAIVRGTPARQGDPVTAIGAVTDEYWQEFKQVGCTEGSAVPRVRFIVGRTISPTHSHTVIVRNGTILYRESQSLGGVVLGDHVEHIAMNNSGDLAMVWRRGDADASTLLLDGAALLQTGDLVDLGGGQSGVVKAFKGVDAISLSDRNALDGSVALYAIADLEASDGSRLDTLLRIDAATAAPPVCVADWDNDGVLGVPDIFAFLADWFAQAPQADFDGNDLIEVPDQFAFLAAWFAGCE